ERWVREGAVGWGWDDVLPVFRRIEAYSGGASELRGGDGLLDVTDRYPRNPIFESIHDAFVGVGVPANPDYNGESIDGVSWMQLTTRGGVRLSTWRAYMLPVAEHPALTVRTGAWVHRLLVEQGR